ncbi:hypothetical protein KAJ89_01705 [Candidatus Parcubacteria bacterium]|nr:hypothetical protein [Candidatus Parcubacteria bacterium]
MQRILLIIFCFILGISLAVPGLAQNDSLALTITPPLIRNNVSPGQLWQSAIRVVNNNDKEITVFARAVDFKGGTEGGTVNFIPKEELEGQKEHLLSEWLVLPTEGVKIAPFQSKDIEFIVAVPETAEPGGHYAAVLIGTAPPAEEFSGATIKVASLLGSLLMLNIGGEVVEQGQIREFSSNKNIYGKAKVEFRVRFQNQGNVHIQPQGEIRITDMRGNQKGQIKINHRTEFGNVLPGDIRRWEYTWDDDISILDMGRYRADLILGYGSETRETANQSLYFWIILFKPLLIILGLIIFFIGSIILFVRRSVKKAIKETQNLSNLVSPRPSSSKKKVIVVPKENGNNHEIVDLKNLGQNKKTKAMASKKSRRGPKMIFLLIIVAVVTISVYAYFKTRFQPVEFDPEFIASDNYETSLGDGLLTDEAGEEELLATTTVEELGTSTLEKFSTSTPVELSTSTTEELATSTEE